jgi:hypothetical protein
MEQEHGYNYPFDIIVVLLLLGGGWFGRGRWY